MIFEEMRERVIAINAEQAQLREEKEILTKGLQEQCTHEVVIELDSTPPHRLCLMCGVEEEGWGCGYKRLNERHVGEPKKIIKFDDEFYRYRQLKPLKQIMVPDNLFTNAGT